jgi:hypothetical protein
MTSSKTNMHDTLLKMFKQTYKLARVWNFTCMLCGHRFETLACISKEHLIPRSMGGTNGKQNIAPTHWMCNRFRGTLSLVVAAEALELRLSKFQTNKHKIRWLNRKIPDRLAPEYALAPISTFKSYLRVLNNRENDAGKPSKTGPRSRAAAHKDR